MSLRDRPVVSRPRWPAEFDIEGIPRDSEVREREKLARLEEEPRPMPQNEIDINKPAALPYVHQEYPRMMYKGTERRKVEDAAGEKKALSEGFSKTPDGKKLLAERARENKKARAKPVSDEPAEPGEADQE
jgi:hypothetical protein